MRTLNFGFSIFFDVQICVGLQKVGFSGPLSVHLARGDLFRYKRLSGTAAWGPFRFFTQST